MNCLKSTTAIFIIAICSTSQVFGQRKPKYATELVSILQQQSSGIPTLLKNFQTLEPENVSIDLQLALVYHERYRNSDVLKDYKYKYGNARKALEYFKIANARIDEKDVKKNTEHYINFGTYDPKGKLIVPYDSVRLRIEQSIPELQAFVDNVPAIYENFTKSYSYYDNAIKSYTSLVGEYKTFKDLILLYDERMETTFAQISADYALALTHFEAYKSAVTTYPIPYNQQLKIKKLETYRLDGLSAEINFLLPEIEIWNYAEWVSETRKYIQSNIDQLRIKLIEENNRINKVLANTQSEIDSENFKPLEISKELMFTLRKFDLKSVIEPIFLFKEIKHDLIFQESQSLQMDANPQIDIERKLYLYSQMIGKIRNADTLLHRISQRNTDETHLKYPDFLSTHYQGKAGINLLVSKEQQQTKADFQHYVGQIQEMILQKEISPVTVQKEVLFKKVKIPLSIMPEIADDSLTQTLITTQRIVNFDNSSFIAGIKKHEKENLTISFLAGVTADGKVAWYREFMVQQDSGINDSHTRVALLKPVPGGCAVIFHGKNIETAATYNQLMILSESGEDRINVRVAPTDFPQIMNYSDRNNTLQIAFKGFNSSQSIQINNQLTLASFNLLGEQLWQAQLEYKGDIFAINPVLDGYVVAGNFNSMRDPEGRLRRIKGEVTDTNMFLLKLSNEGKIEGFKAIDLEGGTTGSIAYRVTDDCLNLFGNRGSYNSESKQIEPDKAVHVMFNRNLEILYNSLN